MERAFFFRRIRIERDIAQLVYVCLGLSKECVVMAGARRRLYPLAPALDRLLVLRLP
jgi:hypothetical protein